jgi:hypothetical protein
MSKIVAVTNAMNSSSNKISNVINSDGYWFFIYDEKFAWAIKSWDHEDKHKYILYFLTVKGNFYVKQAREFELLSRTDVRSLVKNGEAIEYNSNEIGTDEALQAFRLLYTAVKEKGFGIDKVFDEILEG